MSKHHYEASREIAALKSQKNWPYYALIMAAMRLGDTENQEKLKAAFPEVWNDLDARYWAPGGWLDSDGDEVPADIRAFAEANGWDERA